MNELFQVLLAYAIAVTVIALVMYGLTFIQKRFESPYSSMGE